MEQQSVVYQMQVDDLEELDSSSDSSTPSGTGHSRSSRGSRDSEPRSPPSGKKDTVDDEVATTEDMLIPHSLALTPKQLVRFLLRLA